MTPAPGAPCDGAHDAYPPAPESTTHPPGDRGESRRTVPPLTSPSSLTFLTNDPEHPDADDGEVGPVQAVITVTACRKVGPNQTVTTTPRLRTGGATSSRPPGANSDCHGQPRIRRSPPPGSAGGSDRRTRAANTP